MSEVWSALNFKHRLKEKVKRFKSYIHPHDDDDDDVDDDVGHPGWR